jgi:hypothetical protein
MANIVRWRVTATGIDRPVVHRLATADRTLCGARVGVREFLLHWEVSSVWRPPGAATGTAGAPTCRRCIGRLAKESPHA